MRFLLLFAGTLSPVLAIIPVSVRARVWSNHTIPYHTASPLSTLTPPWLREQRGFVGLSCLVSF